VDDETRRSIVQNMCRAYGLDVPEAYSEDATDSEF
jgi:hypothetical protein